MIARVAGPTLETLKAPPRRRVRATDSVWRRPYAPRPYRGPGAANEEQTMRQRNADAAVDVVIIGGGVQGLVILDALIQAGYAPALVTEAELGAGQTLHSHGFLNSGFGMAGPAPAMAAQQIVHPFLRDRGVELRDNWVILPPPGDPGVPALAGLPPAALPAGFAPALGENARKLPDCSFNKRRLVEALSQGREDRIIRGSVIGFEGRAPVEGVRVARPVAAPRSACGPRQSWSRPAVAASACCGSRGPDGATGPDQAPAGAHGLPAGAARRAAGHECGRAAARNHAGRP